MKTYKQIGILLSIITLLLSCKKDNTTTLNPKLIEVGYTSMPLDDDTNFNVNIEFKSINNKPYLHFFNHNNFSIYIYDLQTNALKKKISLEKEGPNGINLGGNLSPSYYIHNLDSIFITGQRDHYLINGDGNVLIHNRFKANVGEGISEGQILLSLSKATYFKNNQLHTGITTYFTKTAPNLLATLPITMDSVITTYLKEDEIVYNYEEINKLKQETLKEGMIAVMGLSFNRHEDNIYATTPISDTVYVYKDEKLIDKIFTGNDAVKLADNRSYFDQFKRSKYKNEQRPTYTNLFLDISDDQNYMFRILNKGASEVIVNQNNNQEEREQKGLALAVVNLDTKDITYLDLPDNINLYSGFVYNKQLYFKLKDQVIENEIQYIIFKVETLYEK